MAYFRCSTGSASSGDGVALIVECDSNFAGSVITADNGEDIFTETCPSVSPYTVRFEGIPTGTYTISGVSQGQTFTTQFTVLDYETTLNATPEGATVLPVNDIQTWLHCANIWNKNYTTISQVLADSSTLLALISSNNAVDYMVRSTSWASSVCANQTAMGYIGNNDYCANKLLSNSTWLTAICNSTYFESVLNVKVPTMTSNTTPSGQAFSSTIAVSGYDAYKAFDKVVSDSDACITQERPNGYVGYKFTSPVVVKKVEYVAREYSSSNNFFRGFVIEASNNGSNWSTLYSGTNASTGTKYTVTFSNSTSYLYYRLRGTENYTTALQELQFYGRA